MLGDLYFINKTLSGISRGVMKMESQTMVPGLKRRKRRQRQRRRRRRRRRGRRRQRRISANLHDITLRRAYSRGMFTRGYLSGVHNQASCVINPYFPTTFPPHVFYFLLNPFHFPHFFWRVSKMLTKLRRFTVL